MMNESTKNVLFFAGGVLVGAVGAVLVSRGKLNLKPLAQDLLEQTTDIKEKALEVVECAKEEIADAIAEAQAKKEAKKEAAELEAAPAPTTTQG